MSRSTFTAPRRLVTGLKAVGPQLLDLLLPAHCHLCEAPASPLLDRVLCDRCGEALPRLEPGCPTCGQPGAPADRPCDRCAAEPPPFDRARALTLYEGKVVEAVQALKYHGRRGLAPLMGRWMAEDLTKLFGECDYRAVVPIPMHWRRRWWRGYNQAELLAWPVASALNAPLELELGRGRPTRRQARLNQQERRGNIAEAFTVLPAAARRLKGASVLIVDDVFTTGATTGVCARSLREAGVARIDVYTLARTP